MSAVPRQRAAVVGLFVAAALVILAGGILTVGDLNDTFARRLTVTATFPEVDGLKPGDNIWFSGVKVGIVSNLELAAGSSVVVVLKIDEVAAAHIPADALAKVGNDGLIGNHVVVVYGGTPTGRTLAEGDTLLPGEVVSTDEVLSMLQQNNANLVQITTNLATVTERLVAGEGTAGRLLVDESLFDSASAVAASLEGSARDLRRVSAGLASFSAKLNAPGGLPNALATDRTTYASLQSTVGNLDETARQGAALATGLRQAADSRQSPIGALLHDAPAGEDVRLTLGNLQRSSELLEENLEALQHSFLLRGYFKKKAREERKADEEEKVEHQGADAACIDDDCHESGATTPDSCLDCNR